MLEAATWLFVKIEESPLPNERTGYSHSNCCLVPLGVCDEEEVALT